MQAGILFSMLGFIENSFEITGLIQKIHLMTMLPTGNRLERINLCAFQQASLKVIYDLPLTLIA